MALKRFETRFHRAPFGNSAGRRAPPQMFRLNLPPVQDRLGDGIREERGDLGTHLIQDSALGSVDVRLCGYNLRFLARSQTNLNVRLMVGRGFVQCAWIGPGYAAVPVASGSCPNPLPAHW